MFRSNGILKLHCPICSAFPSGVLTTSDCKQVCIALVVSRCGMPVGYEVFAGNTADVDAVQAEEETETFILCRSRDRKEKDRAIIKRAADEIAQRLTTMQALGRLLGQNTRAAHLFEVNVLTKDEEATTGKKKIKGKEFARIQWARITAKSDWHELSDGCYLLRSNVSEWSGEQRWKAYIQLTEAENAFRIHKSDLSLRPVWHQKEDRVRAHIFCLFFVLCAMENAWAEVSAGRFGRRAASRTFGTA